MVIKLNDVDHPLSPARRRVLVCLAEKGLGHEFVLVYLTICQQSFISINPFGQVLGFENDDLKLFESRAIIRYIAHAYAEKGTLLISEDPKKMGIIAVWLKVESQKFDVEGQKLSFEILIKWMKGMETDDAIVKQLQTQLVGVREVYETRLAQSKYLGGDDYSLADLYHILIIVNLQKTKFKALFDARQYVAAWAAMLLARSAWARAVNRGCLGGEGLIVRC